MNDTQNTPSRPRPPRTRRCRFWTFKRSILSILIFVVSLTIASAFIPTTRWAYGSGFVMTENQAQIRPSDEGPIVRKLIQDGQCVEEGQLLIQLNNSVQRAAGGQAKKDLDKAKAQLAHFVSENELDESKRRERIFQARRELEVAGNNLKKMKSVSKGAFSQQELIEAKLKVDLAASRLKELSVSNSEVTKKRLSVYKEQIQAAEKNVALYEARLKLRQIRSPIKGLVRLNDFVPGEVVKPEHVLGEVFDYSSWIVRIKLPERYITYVQPGQRVRIELGFRSAMRYGYVQATVSRVVRVVSPRASGDGIFYAEARIDNPGKFKLSPGIAAQADIDTGKTNWLFRILGW